MYTVERAGCGMQACLDLKVQSQNDAKKLAEAKQLVYLKGFTDGVMLAGPHRGEKVRRRAHCGRCAMAGVIQIDRYKLHHPTPAGLTRALQ